MRIAARHALAAACLASAVVAAGVIWNTNVAGGSDSYGYVSQADLWLHGHLHITQGFAAHVPWTFARWTFSPLGYRPARDGYDLVPIYPPGLPLMMAAAKAVAGHAAVFWIVPLCGGLLVFSTYVIGRRIDRPLVGLAAAWLVATSPTLLGMVMAPMSDVPAAAAWTASFALSLGGTRASVACAGLAAAIAIAIRPNLVPLAIVLALGIAWQDVATGQWRRVPSLHALRFVVIAGVGVGFVAAFNQFVYGSPTTSGYGDVSGWFGYAHVVPNVRAYGSWMLSAETPFSILGLLALVVPVARLWRTRRANQARWAMAACVACVWAVYLAYAVFNAWWYLRFLLPTWPMMMLGTATLAAAISRMRWSGARWVAVALVAGLGVEGIAQAVERGAFGQAADEAIYTEVASVVASLTLPDDVILSEQHSGSLRYYAGRMTVRWDGFQPGELDGAVAWFEAHGHHPYLVLATWEAAQLRAKYGPSGEVGRLAWQPLVTFRNGVGLWDGVKRENVQSPMQMPRPQRAPRCMLPAPAPHFFVHAGS